jgi:hypothetical protein
MIRRQAYIVRVILERDEEDRREEDADREPEQPAGCEPIPDTVHATDPATVVASV